MSEFSKQIRELFSKDADEAAKESLDEVKNKGGLFEPENCYVLRKKEEILSMLDSEISEECGLLAEAGALIHEKIPLLSAVEKTRVENELKKAIETLDSITENPLEENKTLQDVLGFSSDTMKWIYGIGYDYFQDKEEDKALPLFTMLTSLNGYVFDYRVAEALTLESLEQNDKALCSFAVATLLKPDHPLPRYHSAELYLKTGEVKDAQIELEAFEEAIKKGNYLDMQGSLEVLKSHVKEASL